MPSSEVSAAQISSRVLRGFEPHNTTAAPVPLMPRASAPVSGVRCSEPAMRIPASGRLRSNSPRRYDSAGIMRSDQSMSDRPRSDGWVATPFFEDDISSPSDRPQPPILTRLPLPSDAIAHVHGHTKIAHTYV